VIYGLLYMLRGLGPGTHEIRWHVNIFGQTSWTSVLTIVVT
jgi:hypothetical protein